MLYLICQVSGGEVSHVTKLERSVLYTCGAMPGMKNCSRRIGKVICQLHDGRVVPAIPGNQYLVLPAADHQKLQ